MIKCNCNKTNPLVKVKTQIKTSIDPDPIGVGVNTLNETFKSTELQKENFIKFLGVMGALFFLYKFVLGN